MPPVGPIKRAALIRHLRTLGFRGPFPGTRHQVMIKDSVQVRLPNPHRGDISVALLVRLLREAGVTREEWERL